MSKLVSIDDLSQLKMLMEDEFPTLVELFVNDSKTLVDNIQSSISANDCEALRIAAHTLKGSSSNMCATVLSELCLQMENKAKSGELTGVDDLLSQIAETHQQTVEVIQSL